MKSINELVLDQARFEFHQRPSADPKEDTTLGSGMASSLKEVASLRGIGMGHIVQGYVKNMTLDIFKMDMAHLSVHSDSAIIDFNKKQTRMKKATLISHSKKTILTSDLIIWDDKKDIFYVPGKYILTTSQGKKTGKKISFPINQ